MDVFQQRLCSFARGKRRVARCDCFRKVELQFVCHENRHEQKRRDSRCTALKIQTPENIFQCFHVQTLTQALLLLYIRLNLTRAESATRILPLRIPNHVYSTSSPIIHFFFFCSHSFAEFTATLVSRDYFTVISSYRHVKTISIYSVHLNSIRLNTTTQVDDLSVFSFLRFSFLYPLSI